MTAALSLRPTWRNIVNDAISVALALPAVGAISLWLESEELSTGWGWKAALLGALGLAGGAFYLVRFQLVSPALVTLDPDALHITPRRGAPIVVPWASVTRAVHRNAFGLYWQLEHADSSVTLRDDGFSADEWQAIASRIRHHCDAHHVPCEVKGLAKAFRTP